MICLPPTFPSFIILFDSFLDGNWSRFFPEYFHQNVHRLSLTDVRPIPDDFFCKSWFAKCETEPCCVKRNATWSHFYFGVATPWILCIYSYVHVLILRDFVYIYIYLYYLYLYNLYIIYIHIFICTHILVYFEGVHPGSSSNKWTTPLCALRPSYLAIFYRSIQKSWSGSCWLQQKRNGIRCSQRCDNSNWRGRFDWNLDCEKHTKMYHTHTHTHTRQIMISTKEQIQWSCWHPHFHGWAMGKWGNEIPCPTPFPDMKDVTTRA